MSRRIQDLSSSLSELTGNDWLAALEKTVNCQGDFTCLGTRHFAALVKRSNTLLVTFETRQGIRFLSPQAHPLGWRMVKNEGWSHLCLVSDGDTWFRTQSVYEYFDDLVDEGFFDQFDTVLFYGAGPCGYAASAFSVAAPGARVLSIQPQATLDPEITEWDDRFTDKRRTDFKGRYGYAPEMLEAAQSAFVLYDPYQRLDAMQAALFTRKNVTKLRLRHMGSALQTDLLDMKIWEPLLKELAEGTLSSTRFAHLLRARRSYSPYLDNLLKRLNDQGRHGLIDLLLNDISHRMNLPRFARQLSQREQAKAVAN